MSFVERRDLNRPTEGEAPFELGETFFSRTDERGVIIAGNEVFRRVAGYSWDELLGAPHKIIRHPDMPKGFFQLLWDTIQSGQPIAGFVKNRAKDNLHYWVLAVVVPVEGGYLSVRMKPSSGMVDTVEEIYARALRREQEDGISPEESAVELLGYLNEAGFDSYSCFQTIALGEELVSMDTKLNNQQDASVASFLRMLAAVKDLKQSTDKLVTFFGEANTIPTNLRLLASRLEQSGGPLSSLSENYWKMSEEMATWFNGFMASSGNAFANIQNAINDAMLLRCATRVLMEAAEQFGRERRNLGGLDADAERQRITELAHLYEAKALGGIAQSEVESKAIANTISILRRHILGLSTTRVMRKIEGAGLQEGGESLLAIIGQFQVFQKTVEEILETIDSANTLVLSNARMTKSLN